MKRKLLDILACPMDKHYPLDLYEFEASNETIMQGILVCPKCMRYYPIIDEIPRMLPDEMRHDKEDIEFLQKWQKSIPEMILKSGKPFHV
ncbi:MAG: Trm112 family protein [Thaumarchaeota archaeon]|nr:Trm112 family protein [Nitrososphaerota archaeon]